MGDRVFLDRDPHAVELVILECSVHGYLPRRADCVAFDASLCKCCHNCLVVAMYFDLPGSGLGCPSALCV